MTLDLLTAECHRIINLRKDASIVEESNAKASMNTIQRSEHFNHHKAAAQNDASKDPSSHNNSTSNNSVNKPRTPCWKCGELHYVRECPFQEHRCQECNRIGHKEGYCQCVSSNPGKKRRFKQTMQTKAFTLSSKSLSIIENTSLWPSTTSNSTFNWIAPLIYLSSRKKTGIE